MLKFLEKHQTMIAIILISILLATFLFLPSYIQMVTTLILLTSIGLAIFFITHKHRRSYQRAECTREKMVRNIALDLLGLLLTMGAAMYIGRSAGGYFGLHMGIWIGLIAGFVGGFAAAWVVRSVWGRLVRFHTGSLSTR